MRRHANNRALRRQARGILAALLCACLLVSYAPLPASADPEASAAGASVGELHAVDPATSQGSTEVSVLAYDALVITNITQGFAAGVDEIKGNSAFDLVVEASGAGPLSYQWYRATLDAAGQPGELQPVEGATSAVYPLSQHAETLVDGAEYRYVVKVVGGDGAEREASVDVTVSDGYLERTLPNGQAAPRVHGLSIFREAELSTTELGASDETYGFLTQQASGLELDGSAWSLAMAGAPADKAPYAGALDVTLPIDASKVPADAAAVTVVGLDSMGRQVTFQAAIDRAAGTATFSTDALGAFAAAYPVPAADEFVITASASPVEGGTIDAPGSTTYAKGATPVYTIRANEGWRIASVKVDGAEADASGYASPYSYTFSAVEDDHAIVAAFERVPVDPSAKYHVTARVEGEGGLVSLDGGAAATEVSADVESGKPATVRFAPASDEWSVESVTVQEGVGQPQNVSVIGDVLTLPAITADTTVVVTYRHVAAPPVPAHTVKASAATEGGVASPAEQTVPHGGAATVTVRAQSGYAIASVKVNGVEAASSQADEVLVLRLENVVEDKDVVASFVKRDAPDFIEVDVTVEARAEGDGGGTVSPSGDLTLAYGASQTFYTYPDEGYDLDRVTVNGDDVQAYPLRAALASTRAAVPGAHGGYAFTVENVTEHTHIVVSFKKLGADDPVPPPVETHQVTARAEGGGTVSPSVPAHVPDGGALSFTFVPDEGWKLVQVTANGADVSKRVSGSVLELADIAEDTEVVATFAASDEVFDIVATVAEGRGSVSPSAVSVAKGADQTFYFYPAEGYRVASVTVDGVRQAWSYGQYTFESVQSPHTLEVSFSQVSASGGADFPTKGTHAKTGDAPWIVLAALAACAAGAVVAFSWRRRNADEEDREIDRG